MTREQLDYLVDANQDLLELAVNAMHELERAVSLNGPFNSAHEGYAVILEELDELWEQVRLKKVNRIPAVMGRECIQIAAMAFRFIIDVCIPMEKERARPQV